MEDTNADNQDVTWTLVQRVKEGDREAFMTLTRMHQKKVFILTYSFFRNKEDALDLVQETFMKLYLKIGTFRRGHNFEAWLLQIAKNLCIDFYRKNYNKRRELESLKTIEELNVPDAGSQGAERASDFKNILSRCVNRLAERQRAVFIMRHFNQLHNDEIAEALGISLGTVKSLHFKAVRNLSALMSPYMGWET